MENNNRKGNLLYLVLGLTTLVVAVIGATFAFFSASANDTTIEGDVAEAGGLLIDVKSVTYDPNDETFATTTGNNIIPLNLITNQTEKTDGDGNGTGEYVDSVSQFDKAMDRKCRDDLGNNICEVYKITVTNQSATATVQVRGTLNLTSTAANMHWKLIEATTETATYSPEDGEPTTFDVLKTATEIAGMPAVKQGAELANTYLTVKNTAEEGSDPVYEGTNVSLSGTNGGNSSATYYVVVWLEEIGTEQQDVDASSKDVPKTYRGTITFDAVDAQGNKSGVTATFLS